MNSKACHGSSAAVEKGEVRWRATIHKWKEHADSFGPKGATTEFVAFTTNRDGGESRARCGCELQICNLGLRSFIGTGTSVVQKQQNGIVPLPLRCCAVGGSEQRFHFRLVKVGRRRARVFFEWNRPDLAAPFELL